MLEAMSSLQQGQEKILHGQSKGKLNLKQLGFCISILIDNAF
jgi:hypothetical protein